MCMQHVVGKHTPGSFMAVITDSMRDPSSPNVFCPFTQYDEKPVSRQQSACITCGPAVIVTPMRALQSHLYPACHRSKL